VRSVPAQQQGSGRAAERAAKNYDVVPVLH
jgi:hypothetical protein